MADLLDKQHIDAGMALLRADAGLTVYPDEEGFTPKPGDLPDHYVRVYATISRPREADGNALTGLATTWITRWYTHSVGPNEASSTAVAMRVNRALLNQRPVIAGRSCGLIGQEAENPPGLDESTGRAVFDTVVVYDLMTTP